MSTPETPSLSFLQDLLINKGIKPSFQRLKILEFIIKSHQHPSVDTIYKSLSKKIPTLSRTTIYNTLTLFTKKGLVNSISICDNEVRYDFADHAHAHFQCRICHKIFDIDIKQLQQSQKGASRIYADGVCPLCQAINGNTFIHGHKVEKVQTILKGLCSECLGEK